MDVKRQHGPFSTRFSVFRLDGRFERVFRRGGGGGGRRRLGGVSGGNVREEKSIRIDAEDKVDGIVRKLRETFTFRRNVSKVVRVSRLVHNRQRHLSLFA